MLTTKKLQAFAGAAFTRQIPAYNSPADHRKLHNSSVSRHFRIRNQMNFTNRCGFLVNARGVPLAKSPVWCLSPLQATTEREVEWPFGRKEISIPLPSILYALHTHTHPNASPLYTHTLGLASMRIILHRRVQMLPNSVSWKCLNLENLRFKSLLIWIFSSTRKKSSQNFIW